MTLEQIMAHEKKTGHQESGFEAGGLEWHCHVCGFGGECAFVKAERRKR